VQDAHGRGLPDRRQPQRRLLPQRCGRKRPRRVPLTATAGTEIRENGSGSNGGDGFHLTATSSDNLLSLNGALGNLGFDCHDESVGTGTAGTANTWTMNFGDTSSPPGLCVPPPAG
jgi:hypothetical protein